MFVKKIVWAVLAAVMVVAFCGCDLWMNDWKGYLEYWSEAVTMGRVEVSGATFQTNDAGVQTLPLDATAKISGYVINPQGHALLENSIEINDPTLANSATKNVADPTLISVLLENVTVAEHTTFTVNFTPERADNGIASTETMSVTLQYNTPPAAPLRMNSDGNGGFEVVQAGGTWNADNAGNLYWKWPYTTTSDIEPNAVKWFSIDGVLYELRECEVPNNSGIYSKNTGNKSVKLAAVDSEGISGSSITSGVTVPTGEVIAYQITFNDDGGSGSNDPIPVVYGQELPPVTPPSRPGYTFGGYYTAQDGGGTQYYDENGDTKIKTWEEFNDTILYAKWLPNKYTVRFDSNGGSGTMPDQIFTYGVSQQIDKNTFTRTGYTFNGWKLDPTFSYKSYDDEVSLEYLTEENNGVVTFYAYWTPNTYTVKFDSNGGTGTMTDQIFTYDSGKSLPNKGFQRSGYLFTGWNTMANGTGNSYGNSDWVENLAPNGEITLYAQWSELKSDIIAQYDSYMNQATRDLSLIGPGQLFLYRTDEGNYGYFEVLSHEWNDRYQEKILKIRWSLPDGSIKEKELRWGWEFNLDDDMNTTIGNKDFELKDGIFTPTRTAKFYWVF